MKKNIRRILSIMLVCAMLTATACGDSNESVEQTPEVTTLTEVVDITESNNSIVLTPEGDIDMEVALAYQTDIDAFLAEMEAKEVNPNETVSDNTNAKTQKVFEYLRDNYGKKVLTAQQMFTREQREDLVYYTVTGDLPAIKGFDLLFTTGVNIDYQQVDAAIEWHTKSNGLVAMCWHWNVPRDIDDPNSGSAFYSEDIVNFSLENAVTPGTKEYEQIIHDIDTMAIQLKRMEAADVPVLWRPLHEASGAWFWWGLKDRETIESQSYQKLWYILYDRLENYHKLSNLIWVWNGQSGRAGVNANTYDISGIDVYPSSEDHSAQLDSYERLSSYTEEGKMLALSECGYIPDVDEMFNSGAAWLYYMPWYGDFIWAASAGGNAILNLDGIPTVNEERLSEDFLKKQYEDERIISWSDLPDWGGTTREYPTRIVLTFPELYSQTESEE